MSPPLATRCPRCFYLPASATVICVACHYDRRDPAPEPSHCAYRGKACDCDGLQRHCMTELA